MKKTLEIGATVDFMHEFVESVFKEDIEDVVNGYYDEDITDDTVYEDLITYIAFKLEKDYDTVSSFFNIYSERD